MTDYLAATQADLDFALASGNDDWVQFLSANIAQQTGLPETPEATIAPARNIQSSVKTIFTGLGATDARLDYIENAIGKIPFFGPLFTAGDTVGKGAFAVGKGAVSTVKFLADPGRFITTAMGLIFVAGGIFMLRGNAPPIVLKAPPEITE